MALSYKYLDKFGNEITQLKYSQLVNKSLLYIEDGLPVKEEVFENNVLFDVEYYLPLGADHNTILNQNNNCGIIEFEIIKDYRKEFGFRYDNGQIIGKSITVVNSNEKSIYLQEIDINTNLPIPSSLNKYYYDQVNQIDYEFYYHQDKENLIRVISVNLLTSDSQVWRPSDISEIPHFDWWREHSSYYLNAFPIIPE